MHGTVRHFAGPTFWDCYHRLPPAVRELADKNFALLKQSPQHPSLRFKQAGRFWSARIGRRYRALAMPTSEGFLWFWIGTHADYDKLLRMQA